MFLNTRQGNSWHAHPARHLYDPRYINSQHVIMESAYETVTAVVTGQLADTPTRRLPTHGRDKSQTGQLADWTTRGCHWRLWVLSFRFFAIYWRFQRWPKKTTVSFGCLLWPLAWKWRKPYSDHRPQHRVVILLKLMLHIFLLQNLAVELIHCKPNLMLLSRY